MACTQIEEGGLGEGRIEKERRIGKEERIEKERRIGKEERIEKERRIGKEEQIEKERRIGKEERIEKERRIGQVGEKFNTWSQSLTMKVSTNCRSCLLGESSG
jgi:UDP-3-O-[3-hydroxymyristoyl] glucosamine N-acyltransferase